LPQGKTEVSDDARKAILSRRAKFVAAALTGISVACGKTSSPEPCLKVAAPPTETAPFDAGADAGDASDGSAHPDAGGLEPVPPTTRQVPQMPPHPCLTPVRPKDRR
jgi:hypothetical protein